MNNASRFLFGLAGGALALGVATASQPSKGFADPGDILPLGGDDVYRYSEVLAGDSLDATLEALDLHLPPEVISLIAAGKLRVVVAAGVSAETEAMFLLTDAKLEIQAAFGRSHRLVVGPAVEQAQRFLRSRS